jgi:hypothetical protein
MKIFIASPLNKIHATSPEKTGMALRTERKYTRQKKFIVTNEDSWSNSNLHEEALQLAVLPLYPH